MNILLQIEAKAVKNASSLLLLSGHSELENGLLSPEAAYITKLSKSHGCLLAHLSFVFVLLARCHLCLLYENKCDLSVPISCNYFFIESITYLGIVRSRGGA